MGKASRLPHTNSITFYFFAVGGNNPFKRRYIAVSA